MSACSLGVPSHTPRRTCCPPRARTHTPSRTPLTLSPAPRSLTPHRHVPQHPRLFQHPLRHARAPRRQQEREVKGAGTTHKLLWGGGGGGGAGAGGKSEVKGAGTACVRGVLCVVRGGWGGEGVFLHAQQPPPPNAHMHKRARSLTLGTAARAPPPAAPNPLVPGTGTPHASPPAPGLPPPPRRRQRRAPAAESCSSKGRWGGGWWWWGGGGRGRRCGRAPGGGGGWAGGRGPGRPPAPPAHPTPSHPSPDLGLDPGLDFVTVLAVHAQPLVVLPGLADSAHLGLVRHDGSRRDLGRGLGRLVEGDRGPGGRGRGPRGQGIPDLRDR